MTPQSSFMVVVPVIAEKLESLNALLSSMNFEVGRVNPHNSIIPFANYSDLHSARLLILTANTGHDMEAYGSQPHDWSPSLALLGEIDGTQQDFLARLTVTASKGLTQLLEHCQGFSSHKGTLLDFLLNNSKSSAANYVNWLGRTVTQVSEELELQQLLAAKLPDAITECGIENPRKIRQVLLNHVEFAISDGTLTLTPEAKTPLGYRLRNLFDLVAIPTVLLLVSPVMLILAPLIAWRLRVLERSDPDIIIRPEPEHMRTLSVIEDHDVTNQFNVFGDIKPGMFRLLLLKFIMRIVQYTAQHIYRRGFLARVRTIHFARWVFLNDNRSMYFSSMYDGSLESYMDDFINKVAFGLNLTFSHGVGYPRTRWMVKGGAELEEQFKDTLRRHQLPSAVWYRANPGLTAFDMARNARIRRGVETYPTEDQSIRQWLSEI